MIVRDDRDGIRTLRLAHGKVSAMDIELGEAFVREIDAASDASVRAVVLTGTGSTFSAGVDLHRLLRDGPDYVRRFLPVLDNLLQSALTFPKPLVAAINGHAIAGGCILAVACDRRIMADGKGRIGIPELAVGVPFPALPMAIVASRLSDQVVRDLALDPRTIDVNHAVAVGLVDEKCAPEQVLDRAVAAARRMSSIPALAFALTKEAFYMPILERARQLDALNPRGVDAWVQAPAFDAIRAYLDRTLKK